MSVSAVVGRYFWGGMVLFLTKLPSIACSPGRPLLMSLSTRYTLTNLASLYARFWTLFR